jgi:hypothetical protein
MTMRPTGKHYDIPTPLIAIGTKVPVFRLDKYSRRCLVRHLVTKNRSILKSLRREGYATRERGEAMLSSHVKSLMRATLNLVDTAYEIEVAGIQGVGHHLGLQPVNGCYVGGGQSASGLQFYCQLLFRGKQGTNHVVFLMPLHLWLFHERMILNLLSEKPR